MAQDRQQKASESHEDDDWEELQPSRPDDAISIVSEDEAAVEDSHQDYVEVDHPRKTSYPGRNYSSSKDEPSGPLPTLRKALYDLKDTLRDCVTHLEDFNQEASMQALSLSGPIMQTQQRQVDALNILLTNDAKDWEASASSGGMTFDEFADLDPVSVNELCRIFRNFGEEVQQKTPIEGIVSEDEAVDKDEDLGWLDFILPAVDEVSMLLRVPEDEPQSLNSY